jgi:transcriptional regulator with XRE-family HTH domain
MLSNKIREIRIKNGMSLYRLAKLSGHAVSTIHGIENGDNKNPSFKMIGDIAKVLDIPLDGLYQECIKERLQ